MHNHHKTITLLGRRGADVRLRTDAAHPSGAARTSGKGRLLRRVGASALAAAAASAALVLSAPAAMATPPDGVSARVLWQTTSGGTDYVLREVTIAPGGTTGWHYHDGTLYAVTRSGTLTHEASTCHVDGLYTPGSPILEPSGAGHVHRGVNLGTTPVVLEVLYVQPAGSPASESAPDPGCAPLG